MSQLVGELPSPLTDGSHRYRASIYADQLPDGRWEAWLEFTDLGTGDCALTGVETRQHDLRQLLGWVRGLTPRYVEGSFARARRSMSPARFLASFSSAVARAETERKRVLSRSRSNCRGMNPSLRKNQPLIRAA